MSDLLTVEEPPWGDLDDGIRETVRALWWAGFQTCDSGDGSKAGAMACAIAEPHVFMQCEPCVLISEADRLNQIVIEWAKAGRWRAPEAGPTVQACYLPGDGVAILELYGSLS